MNQGVVQGRVAAAVAEAQTRGLVGEGAVPVSVTPAMLGQGAGFPMPVDVMADFLRGKDGWKGVPDQQDE